MSSAREEVTTLSQFGADLGLSVTDRDADGCRLDWPYLEYNAAFGTVHGGALAGACHVAATACVVPNAEKNAVQLGSQITYCRKPGRARLRLEARIEQSTSSLAFVRVLVKGRDEQVVAFADIVLSRAKEYGVEYTEQIASQTTATPQFALPAPKWLVDASDAIPFLQRHQISILGTTQSDTILLQMPDIPINCDANGRIEMGAMLGLLDAAGSSAPWLGLDPPEKAGATVLLQTQTHSPVSGGPILAVARIISRTQRDVWVEVQLTSAQSNEVYVTGHIAYRMPHSNSI